MNRSSCRRTRSMNASVIAFVALRWRATSFQEMSVETCCRPGSDRMRPHSRMYSGVGSVNLPIPMWAKITFAPGYCLSSDSSGMPKRPRGRVAEVLEDPRQREVVVDDDQVALLLHRGQQLAQVRVVDVQAAQVGGREQGPGGCVVARRGEQRADRIDV